MNTNKTPNVIYIYADDLGMGMLSCYGQSLFRTPNIDRIAQTGIRFTNGYGTGFCAPARASLLCGIHDAHAGRWSFCGGGLQKKVSAGQITDSQAAELVMNTGIQERCGETYLATVFRNAGYVTGEIGKLEWGFNTCAEEMDIHGWDYHYGFYDHIACHGFYPPFIHENGRMVKIDGNTRADFGYGSYFHQEEPNDYSKPDGRAKHSQDLFDDQILKFIRKNARRPFFLYHPSQIPHGPVYEPDIHPSIASRSDLIAIEKEYVSMILRLDRTVGLILDELERLDLRDRTIVIFSADNGHECQYYSWKGRTLNSDVRTGAENRTDNPFRTKVHGDTFNGNCGLAGLKWTNFEGGVRVPLIASMPGTISPSSTSNHLISNYDMLALACDLTGQELPAYKDGLSFLPVLRGEPDAPEHAHVVFGSPAGPGLVTNTGLKIRTQCRALGASPEWQVFNLNEDPEEERNLAEQDPGVLKELKPLLIRECDGNPINGQSHAHYADVNIALPSWDELRRGAI